MLVYIKKTEVISLGRFPLPIHIHYTDELIKKAEEFIYSTATATTAMFSSVKNHPRKEGYRQTLQHLEMPQSTTINEEEASTSTDLIHNV